MTARAATSRCYVALVTLVTTLLALVTEVVRLLGASVAFLAALVERATPARAPKAIARAPQPRDVVPLRLVPPCPTAPTPPVGPVAPTAAERLQTALTGMGWRAADVARVVGQLGPRVDRERIETLIPECLRALSPAALVG
jgi:hypothetical protein